VGTRAGLDGCGKSRPPPGIRSPDEIDVGEDIIAFSIYYRYPVLSHVSILSGPLSGRKHFASRASS